MADIFSSTEMRTLLDGKYVLFFGDSNMRALYKDVITLYQKNKLISESALRRKLERSFEGDTLLHSTGLTKGRDFKEHRCFKNKDTQVEFFFITKCLCPEVTNTLHSIMTGKKRAPDVLFMNSTLWDITRWGFESVAMFKENLKKLVELFKRCLPTETLVIWQTVPPLSNVRRAFLIPEVEFMNYTIRFEAMEANMFAHTIFTSSGYDILDFHHHLRLNVLRRVQDGVHWKPEAVRYMTNLFLTYISIAWERPLPYRFATLQLNKLMSSVDEFLSENGRKPVTSTSPSLTRCTGEAIQSTKMEEENVSADAQTTRIAAKDRLGEIVLTGEAQPQEDLRAILVANSLNASNTHCMNTNRSVKPISNGYLKSNGSMRPNSNRRRGSSYRVKGRSRGPAQYTGHEVINQQNIRGGRGHRWPAHRWPAYPPTLQNMELRYAPYQRTTDWYL